MSFEKFTLAEYKEKLFEQLNNTNHFTEKILAYMDKQLEWIDLTIKMNMSSFRYWLAKKLKWKWLVRDFKIEHHRNINGEQVFIYKGSECVGRKQFNYGRSLTFRRYSE
jgi:hypothetical protein